MAGNADSGDDAWNSANFDEAHQAVRADPTLQFEVEPLQRQTQQSETPGWLRAIGEFVDAIAPLMVYVFWGGVIIVVGMLLWIIGREIIRRAPARARDTAAAIEDAPKPEFRPQHQRAQALLEEADRLAREGQFSEAVRVLLHRSIEDLETAFPGSIEPAMTSREIGRLGPLSDYGRRVFGQIAASVERSLFGGAALDAAVFAQCREAYQAFAFGRARS